MEVLELEQAVAGWSDREEFTRFVTEVEPRLRRAFVSLRGRDAGDDAVAEALAWAWVHWAEVREMANPAGYLYRVGSSRSRPKRARFAELHEAEDGPVFEPGLAPALGRLSSRQRTAVVLVHGCGWTHQEVADAMGVSRSAIGTYVVRGMAKLRKELGVVGHG